MSIDKKFIDEFVRVTSRAALATYHLLGLEDKISADKAAVDSMRHELNKINMNGQIVIGEGEIDKAPMLFIGEMLGSMKGPEFDIAVDPLEGTNFAAKNLPGALSVIAVSEKSNLLKAPETYMEKIATSQVDKGVIDLDYSVEKNISNLAEFKNKLPNQLTACIMDRPRHKNIIETLKKMNVKLKLITDGDISGALLVSNEKYKVDIFFGIGGGPEGVLAAVALDTFNCHFQGRFIFKTSEDKNRALKMGIKDLDKKYELNEIISGDSIFCATGVTSGDLVNGIKINKNKFYSETFVTHKSSGSKQIIKLNQII